MVALLDLVEEVASGVVRVTLGELCGLVSREVLDALFCLEMQFDVMDLASCIDPLVGVAGVAVHVAVAIGSAAVGEEDRDLVDALRHQRPEVPHCVGIAKIGLRRFLLGVDEVRELHGVADEEDRRVVADHVEVALLRVELDREAARVTVCIRGASLASHRAESQEKRGALAHFVQESSLAVLAHICGHLEEPVRSCALGMHHPLRDALSVQFKSSPTYRKLRVYQSGASQRSALGRTRLQCASSGCHRWASPWTWSRFSSSDDFFLLFLQNLILTNPLLLLIIFEIFSNFNIFLRDFNGKEDPAHSLKNVEHLSLKARIREC